MSTDKPHRTRFSVTLTPPYIERLDRLVKSGLFLDNQEIIRIAMRRLFKDQGIPMTIEEIDY